VSDDDPKTMLDLLTELMARAPTRRCTYAEARQVTTDHEDVLVRNGRVEQIDSESADGIGVRVRAAGGWGFAATRDITSAGMDRAMARALAIAESQPAAPSGPLAAVDPACGHWTCDYEQDPLAVSLEDKLELLFAAEAALRTDARIVRSEAECSSRRVRSAFASTEAAACTQVRVECGAAITAIALDGAELQVRSYPSAHGGSPACTGWEHVLAVGLVENAPRVAAEAVELLTAPACPEGRATIVLDGDQLALQIHESIGHALELDRMLLGEASYAGTSWVSPADLGGLRYGSELLNITADATLPGGLGSFGWDDEGVAAMRTPLIEAGVLRAALSDRQSAAAVGLERSGGCARADGFARQPIVRMTNVSIEPGDAGTLADLIADTGTGLFLQTNRSW
jgi:TldD protein